MVSSLLLVGSFWTEETHVDESQINIDAVKHSTESSHEDCKSGNAPMPRIEDLSIGGFGIDVCEDNVSKAVLWCQIGCTEDLQVL